MPLAWKVVVFVSFSPCYQFYDLVISPEWPVSARHIYTSPDGSDSRRCYQPVQRVSCCVLTVVATAAAVASARLETGYLSLVASNRSSLRVKLMEKNVCQPNCG
jgi:hypothetical protein